MCQIFMAEMQLSQDDDADPDELAEQVGLFQLLSVLVRAQEIEPFPSVTKIFDLNNN